MNFSLYKYSGLIAFTVWWPKTESADSNSIKMSVCFYHWLHNNLFQQLPPLSLISHNVWSCICSACACFIYITSCWFYKYLVQEMTENWKKNNRINLRSPLESTRQPDFFSFHNCVTFCTFLYCIVILLFFSVVKLVEIKTFLEPDLKHMKNIKCATANIKP